jgi:hypothetical protein
MEPDLGHPCAEHQRTPTSYGFFWRPKPIFPTVRAILPVDVEFDRGLVTRNFDLLRTQHAMCFGTGSELEVLDLKLNRIHNRRRVILFLSYNTK